MASDETAEIDAFTVKQISALHYGSSSGMKAA